MLAAQGGLVIDWVHMPTYNTIMSIAAGAGLRSLISFAREIKQSKAPQLEAWALAFAVPGAILAITGAHMTLTWPLAKYFPFDNIIFGETSLGFGILLLAAALYLWKVSPAIIASGDMARYLSAACRPMSLFIFGLGLALIGIAAAGLVYRLFAAPAEEPISGAFAAYPWVEAIFMSGLFGLVGIGAVLVPFALRGFSSGPETTVSQQIVGWAWAISGLGFLLFGALNFFTHIGLILHTMG